MSLYPTLLYPRAPPIKNTYSVEKIQGKESKLSKETERERG
jgi:hypothetical protein